MLFFLKIRFLSLMPAIKSILPMFKPLKEYFVLVKCSLKDLFENFLGEI